MRLLLKCLWVILILTITACTSNNPTENLKGQPMLKLENYFNGQVKAWGVFLGRDGAIKKQFTVIMHCQWDTNGIGTLDEDFTYSDGTKQKRIWTLHALQNGEYSGTADDVVGVAKGKIEGSQFKWNYVLALDVDGKKYHVNMDDTMMLMDDNVMLNRAIMKKFGLKLGEVLLTFQKSENP